MRPSSHPILAVVLRRLVLAVPLLVLVPMLTFALVSAGGADPARVVLPPFAPAGALAHFRHQFGLDRPWYVQFGRWLAHAARGDLGASFYSGQPVTQIIGERVGVTMSLTLTSLLVISILGIALGVYSAVRGGRLGRFVDGLSLVGFAVPGFWLGAVLIGIFAVTVRWLPAIGYVPLTQSPTMWARSLILPAVALGINQFAVLARQTREAMMDTLASEHIRMSWANGIPARDIYFRLALKNTAIRVLTIVGLQMIGLLLGAVFIEQVFALPGLGSLLVSATQQRDVVVVEGITFFFTILIIGVNLVIDLLYTALDPRVRTS